MLTLQQMHLYYKQAIPVAVSELFVRNQDVHQDIGQIHESINGVRLLDKRALVCMGNHLWSTVARDLENMVHTKYLLKDTRNYCLKYIGIYYAEYEPARTPTITCSCYFVYICFYFSTLNVLLIHIYIEYSIILALILSTLVLVQIHVIFGSA